jgi:hypothetical protein
MAIIGLTKHDSDRETRIAVRLPSLQSASGSGPSHVSEPALKINFA